MELASFGANFSSIFEHLQLVVILLFCLPAISFAAIKFWIACRSKKIQPTTNWFVPDDLDSEVACMHYKLVHNSAAFAHQIHRNSPTQSK